MSQSIDRRRFLGVAAATGVAAGLRGNARGEVDEAVAPTRTLLTDAKDFFDVSRGNPKPHSLRGEELINARLTPATWRLEIIGDGSSELARPHRLEDDSALNLEALETLGKTRGVRYLKAMQCNNIPVPLGQGLWEGVPLREVVRQVGKIGNVRRVYYWGFHNNDPKQVFQSSLGLNRVLESPPWEPPPLVAYRLNGHPIPIERGGPVRMIVPWAHGFKSIKWLQQIVLTNDYKANDTYALENNDPESALKTAAYLGQSIDAYRKTRPSKFKAGAPIVIEGTAIAGASGLKRVEYWLRPATGGDPKLADDDPAWASAKWRPCVLMSPPDDWDAILPAGVASKDVWGFDPMTGAPKEWPLPFNSIAWTAHLAPLAPGAYEFRARTVDRNDFAQPEPRPYQKSGMNLVPFQMLAVS